MPAPQAELQLLAGDIGGPGNLDGTGAAARFNGPSSVAVDGAGNLYVADQANHLVRKITPAGVVTALAGAAGVFGDADGGATAARFSFPAGVAVDGAGNVYVVDTNNSTIRKITSNGVVSTLAGAAGVTGSTDATGTAARFRFPSGAAVDVDGNVYVADRTNHVIRKITPAGVVTTLAGTAGVPGFRDDTGTLAQFNLPSGVAVDRNGNLYVADQGNHLIRKISPAAVVQSLAGSAGQPGSMDATGGAARFNAPTGVAIDSGGNVYVADQGNHVVRRITPTGVVTTPLGTAGMEGSADGTGAAARFNAPMSVAVDSAGNIYVADQLNHVVRKATIAGIVTTPAGAPSVTGVIDGAGAKARFDRPSGVAVDSAGNAYVSDTEGNTIRKITPAGDATTLAGTAGVAGGVDGMGAAARFNEPGGVAVDSAGNIYVADNFNNTVRKITPAGLVTTLAGTAGSAGRTDGKGAAARFDGPAGVAVDASGTVFVTDQNNHTIRKVTADGTVTTLAGGPGMSGTADGKGSAARFNFPGNLAIDGAGNLFVVDESNYTIRKVTADGMVTTLAGAPGMTGSMDGTGAAARFNAPTGVAVDSAGNVYVADSRDSTIRKITPDGVTTTAAGVVRATGIQLGKSARLGQPRGLAISSAGFVICDANAVLLLRLGAP